MNNETIEKDILYPTGLNAFDQRLKTLDSDDYGIPNGSLILILTPPQSNLSTLFAQKVLINLLEDNQDSHAYYIHSSRPQNILVKEFKAYNWDISKYQQLHRWDFIDMWHITSSHVASSSKIGKIDIRRKTYLKQAFRRILQIHENNNTTCFTVIDNLLWLKEDDFDLNPSKILEFFKELTDLVIEIGGIHFLILPKGIIDLAAENMISSAVNGIIEFDRVVSGNKNQDRVSITKMMGVAYKSDILDITPDDKEGLRIESTGKV